MAASRTVLRPKDTTSIGALYMSFDLGDKHWQMVDDNHLGRPATTILTG